MIAASPINVFHRSSSARGTHHDEHHARCPSLPATTSSTPQPRASGPCGGITTGLDRTIQATHHAPIATAMPLPANAPIPPRTPSPSATPVPSARLRQPSRPHARTLQLPSPARHQHWQRRRRPPFYIKDSRKSYSARCYSAQSDFL
ncbi:hypothetical protein ACLOJK_004439 [Asimina triloba]